MATKYKELISDVANMFLINRISEDCKKTNKPIEEASKEVLLTAFKDYSKLNNSLEDIDKQLTSNNGITMLGIMKQSFSINFISALNKTLDKLGYENKALEILKETSINKDFSKINSEQINSLMSYWCLKNERYDNDDFDDENFFGDFNRRLDDMGYVRLAVEKTENTSSMILLKKDYLDSLIEKTFSISAFNEDNNIYYDDDQTYSDDFIGAYSDIYKPIYKELNLDLEKTTICHNGYEHITDKYYEIINSKAKEVSSNEVEEFPDFLSKIVNDYENVNNPKEEQKSTQEEKEEESEDEYYEDTPFLQNILKEYDESQNKKTYINIIDKDTSEGDSLEETENNSLIKLNLTKAIDILGLKGSEQKNLNGIYAKESNYEIDGFNYSVYLEYDNEPKLYKSCELNKRTVEKLKETLQNQNEDSTKSKVRKNR